MLDVLWAVMQQVAVDLIVIAILYVICGPDRR